MLGKLINLGKKNKFHLELKEDDNFGIAPKVEAVATQVKQETQQKVQEAKQAIAKSPVIKEIKSETKEIIEEVKAKATEVAPKAKKTSIKGNKKTTSKKKEAAPVISPKAKAVVDTSYSDEPFWVKQMYKTSEQKAVEENAEKTFATDFLISKPQPRRRPGGSLDSFKNMARQTKVRF
jgi:hypothetical protein